MDDYNEYSPILNSSLLNLDENNESFDAYKTDNSNFSLKSGLILKIHETTDNTNISKKHVEYDVLAIDQNKDLGTASVIYKNCMMMQGMGGIGDFFEYKLRPPKGNLKQSATPQKDTGSSVLLLCLNGNESKAVILGCLNHNKRNTTLTKSNGNHLEGEFNGVNFKITDDGALTLTFKSKTDNNGSPQDSASGGSFYKMHSDGSIELNDSSTESIKINKVSKDITVNAGGNINSTASKSITQKASKNVELNANAELIMQAQGNATLKTAAQLQIQSAALTNIKAPNVKMDIDNALNIKANSVFLKANFVEVGQGGAPALIFATQYIGIGNLGAPVVSIAMGPFSGTVTISS